MLSDADPAIRMQAAFSYALQLLQKLRRGSEENAITWLIATALEIESPFHQQDGGEQMIMKQVHELYEAPDGTALRDVIRELAIYIAPLFEKEDSEDSDD